MKHVLAFFGAFNPPTKAHIQLAEFAVSMTNDDGVLFVPSKSVYISGFQMKSYSYSDKRRYEMLMAVARNRPWMEVTDYELNCTIQPKTYMTLQYLRSIGYAPKLLIGSGKLPELEYKWLYVPEIASEFGIVCMERSEDNCNKLISENNWLKDISSHIMILNTPLDYQHISSSDVRRIISTDEGYETAEDEMESRYFTFMDKVPEEIIPLL